MMPMVEEGGGIGEKGAHVYIYVGMYDSVCLPVCASCLHVCMYVCILCLSSCIGTCLLGDFDEKVCFAITKLCSVPFRKVIIHTNYI